MRAWMIAAFVLGGCCSGGPGGSRQRLAEWHFENDCSTDLCGFTAVQGSATRVVALTPGEHALQLSAGTVLQQNFSVPISPVASPAEITMAARCDAGTNLAVQVVMDDMVATANGTDGGAGDGGPFSTQRVQETDTTMLTASTAWRLLDGALIPVNATPRAIVSQRATQIQISVVGSGSCTIDDVVLTGSSVVGGLC